MTAAAMLADEDYVLPEALRAKVLRRRGDGGAPTSIDESLDRLLPWIDKVCALADSSFEKALADPASEPDLIADRLVPDLGLDANGTMTLDFGPRRFVVGFDAELKASVHDASGRRLKNLPKPAAGDDPEFAKTAARAFAELKKQARTVVADQVARLERAMVLRRRWDAVEFSAFFVHHPLVRHILLVATLDPGITVGDVAESADQVFEGVWISRDGRAGHRPVPEWSDPFGTLDPVTASEILRDLTEVTAQ